MITHMSDMPLQPKQSAFLKAFEKLGTITHAAQAAKVDRSRHYAWMDDPNYARQFNDARLAFKEALEREATRRAIEGTEKPVYQGGKMVGTITEYSDTLLIFLLKANDQEKYTTRVKADINITREDRVSAIMERLQCSREEAEQAVAEAERIVAG